MRIHLQFYSIFWRNKPALNGMYRGLQGCFSLCLDGADEKVASIMLKLDKI